MSNWLNKKLATLVTRREFNAAVKKGLATAGVVAVGMPILLDGCVGTNTGARNSTLENLTKDDEQSISDLMLAPKTQDNMRELVGITQRASSQKNPVLAQKACLCLASYKGIEVYVALTNVFNSFSTEERLRRDLVQYMFFNFGVNREAQVSYLAFIFKTMRPANTQAIVKREFYSGIIYINNMTFRYLRKLLRDVRLYWNNLGAEMAFEEFLEFMIQATYEPFTVMDRFGSVTEYSREWRRRYAGNPDADISKLLGPIRTAGKSKEQQRVDGERFLITSEKIDAWRVRWHSIDRTLGSLIVFKDANSKSWSRRGAWLQALADDSESNKPAKELWLTILAMLNLDEYSPLPKTPDDRALLIDILDDDSGSFELKEVVLAIFGSDLILDPDVQARIIKFLKHSDKYLALAAAKALRFREGLPAEEILDILKGTKDIDVRLQMGDQILSSLSSPRAFYHLACAMILSETEVYKQRRAVEFRVWYAQLGDRADAVVHQATRIIEPGVSEKDQNLIINWLRDIRFCRIRTDMPSQWRVFQSVTSDGLMLSDPQRDAEITADLQKLDPILQKYYKTCLLKEWNTDLFIVQ